MTILCIYHGQPEWDAPEGRAHHHVVSDGVDYWVETDGPAPSEDELRNVRLYGTADVAAMKASLRRAVDSAAEEARQRFLTPGSGMVMTYQEKFAQAQAVDAMGETAANAMNEQDREEQFPTLAASVGIEAATLWECAQLVLQKYAEFAQLSLVIERTRLAGKKAISDASDAAAVHAAHEAITWPTP